MDNHPQPQKPTRPSRQRLLGGLVAWIILVPVVFGTLIGFSELAMVLDMEQLAADTRSFLQAVYQPWPYDQIPPINVAAFIEDVQKELELLGTPAVTATVQEGAFWVPATPVGEEPQVVDTPVPAEPVPPPTSTPAPANPTNTATATRPVVTPQPTQTPTSTATATRTVVIPLPTQTPIPPTDAPPPTKTPTPPPTQTPTATFTKIIPTLTPTQTASPTKTQIPTATRTPTPRPTSIVSPTITVSTEPPTYHVIPIAENLGESSPDPDGRGCVAFFGYANENPIEVDIPEGEHNYLSQPVVEISPDGSLPTHFLVDHRVSLAFAVVWDVAGPISWFLDGVEATAQWCNP